MPLHSASRSVHLRPDNTVPLSLSIKSYANSKNSARRTAPLRPLVCRSARPTPPTASGKATSTSRRPANGPALAPPTPTIEV